MILYGNFFRSFSLDFPPLGPLPCMVRFDSCNLVSSTARWSPGLVCAVACYFCSSTLLLLGLHAAFTQLWACLLSQPCICGVKWMKYRDRLRGVTVTTQAAQSRKFLHPGMRLLTNPCTELRKSLCTWLRDCFRQAEAEVISSSSNKFHQTTYEDFFSTLYDLVM